MSKRQKVSKDEFIETIADAEFNEEADEIRDLVRSQNRKKKSGGFQSMGLSASIFKGIMKKGYKVPTPIQRKTIPVVLDGKDLVAMARTGSGKTAAFLVPMFERLKSHSNIGIRALILSPTRELAIQTQKFTKQLGKFTNLASIVMFGGESISEDFEAMHSKPDIVIATPGRLMQILMEMDMKLSHVEYVVFDEADRLFEMGFQEQLNEILKRLPQMRQTLLFSATLPKLLLEFAKAGLNNPALIKVDGDNKLSQDLKLSFLMCRSDDRTAVLLHLLKNVIKRSEQTVVFVATTHLVEYINMIVTEAGFKCSYIFSALDQTARIINMEKFRHRRTSILIATDAMARGIDIPLLDNVINYNFADKPKLFLHRVGRVARAGRLGTAYSIVCPEDMAHVIDLHMFLGRPIKLAQMNALTEDDSDLCGRVPQVIIDERNQQIEKFHDKTEIQNILKAAKNAFSRYCKTKASPSAESVRRAKEISDVVIGFHPVFGIQDNELEAKHDKMLEAIKNYKPRENVLSKQQAGLCIDPELTKAIATRYCPKRKVPKTEDVTATSASGPLVIETKMKSGIEVKDPNIWEAGENVDEIWGSKDDQLTTWNTDAHSFDIGSEVQETKKNSTNRVVWCRIKKKFVNEAQLKKPEKKIKQKPHIYQKWLKDNKVDERADGDESMASKSHRVLYNKNGRKRRFHYQNNTESIDTKKMKVRDTMKTKEQILKERRVTEQKKSFQTYRAARKEKNKAKNQSGSGHHRGKK